MLKTYKIILNGRVQGVGFRPFVHGLANSFGLAGYVSNNEEGVVILLSGDENKIRDFYKNLLMHPPPLARIKKHFLMEVERQVFKDFEILATEKKNKLNLALTPDFGICAECRDEILDPENRRYLYPFTTCVNCGPRWSITKTFPFERNNTSLLDFKMCESCQREYDDPANRRFHSQTNTCSDCGIHLQLETAAGEVLEISARSIFKKISDLIQQGHILALKNTGGYLLCCDAANVGVIKRLRHLKRRPKKPFAVLYPNLELLEQHLDLNPIQKNELCSTERPIVVVSNLGFKGDLALEHIAPQLKQLGVMLPYTGILQLLSEELKIPVIATSGNFHGSPIISQREKARELISGIADYFVHHNLPISNAQDDSVIKYSFSSGQKVMFRRSRGYAPNFFEFDSKVSVKILAMGSHLKSTLAFIPNDFLYISQYLGNLDHFDVYQRFVETANSLTAIFEQEPNVILVDKHPGYLSTQYGMELSEKYRAESWSIQHHKAHFASVLGEHEQFETNDPVLGVVWDGTGYGDDRQIWGGEFFMYQNHTIERFTHFDYFDWLAGDKMAQEPRLSLLSLMKDDDQEVLPKKFQAHELGVYRSLKKNNKLKTSSVGRLFDAVASLLNICDINTYEGEAAILLENVVLNFQIDQCKSYFSVGDQCRISTQELWDNLYADFLEGVRKEVIINNFFFTLATIILKIAANKEIKKIACSGGVFQNTTLIDVLKELSGNQFELYFNRNLAPNDENISYGQVMYYLNCTAHDKT